MNDDTIMLLFFCGLIFFVYNSKKDSFDIVKPSCQSSNCDCPTKTLETYTPKFTNDIRDETSKNFSNYIFGEPINKSG